MNQQYRFTSCLIQQWVGVPADCVGTRKEVLTKARQTAQAFHSTIDNVVVDSSGRMILYIKGKPAAYPIAYICPA